MKIRYKKIGYREIEYRKIQCRIQRGWIQGSEVRHLKKGNW